MRTKQNINMNQCDKCGKIQEEGELFCPDDEDSEWEGLALCGGCNA